MIHKSKILELIDKTKSGEFQHRISYSAAKDLDSSPARYAYRRIEKKKSKAMLFGRAFHTYILEPDKFDDKIRVYEGKSRRNKGYKKLKEKTDKTIITSPEMEKIDIMAQELQPLIQDYINMGDTEVFLEWEQVDTEIPACAKIDILVPVGDGLYDVVDVKTARSAEPNKFSRDMWYNKYHLQGGSNKEAIEQAIDGKLRKMIYSVIEKKPPFDRANFEINLGSKFFELGERDWRKNSKDLLYLINNPNDFMQSYHFRAPFGSFPIDLPKYAQ